IIAPIDDTKHLFFWGYYSMRGRKPPHEIGLATRAGDVDSYASIRGDRSTRWGQDRALVKAGHFTGFPRSLIEEDLGIQASMGRVVDRTKENLSSSDVAVVQTRRMLLKSLDDLAAGKLPPGSALGDAVRVENPLDTVLPAGTAWGFSD